MKIRTLGVYELNNYIKKILSEEPILENLQVRGEISNFKIHNSGNVYLSLKDENSKINCIIFKNNYDKEKKLKDGLKVIASGYISTYVRDGAYQLYIKDVEIEGEGRLYYEFMKLKSKLESKGYFSPMHKKKIPSYPKNIGVVTSPTGAVIRDIINVISRRYPKVGIKLYPVLVQGPGSREMIVKGIEFFNQCNNVDTIIIGRGGGSIEELWSFNEEIVADAIYNSTIPIISAVGHETDFTISDFVADMRAPTPSAAAEIATPNLFDIKNRLDTIMDGIGARVRSNIRYDRNKTKYVFSRICSIVEKDYVYGRKMELDYAYDKLKSNMNRYIDEKRESLNRFSISMSNLNPFSIMERGYSLVEKDEKVINSIQDIDTGDKIEVLMSDGRLLCEVIESNKNDKQ